MKNAILFITHFENEFILQQLNKINREMDHNKYDLWILYNGEKSHIKYDKIFFFNKNVVEENGFNMHYYYRGAYKADFYGNNFEYSFLTFYKNHPEYNFYWIIEYDVYANMNWNSLFSFYDENRQDVDFYSTHLEKLGYEEDVNKITNEWKALGNYVYFSTIKNAFRIKCFNPIDRFSNKALSVLMDEYLKGNYGFYEVAMPTIFYNHGLKIKNFGKKSCNVYHNEIENDSEFLDDFSDHEEFLNSETDRFGPSYSGKIAEMQNMIYHPVKFI